MKKKWPVLLVVGAIVGCTILYMVMEMQYTTATGKVIARRAQDVMIDFPSKIEAIYVQEGQSVKAGDALLSLSLGDLQAQMQSKENEMVQARTEMQTENAAIAQLQNNIQNATADLNQSQNEWQDKAKLFGQGAISRYELDKSASQVRADEKTLNEYQLSLAAKTRGTSSMQAYQEHMVKLKSELKALQDRISLGGIHDNRMICTVAHGIVCEIGYAAGDQVQNDQKILRILDLDSLVIEAPVAEGLIKDVKVGALVQIVPLADPGRHYQGRVVKISRMAVVKNGDTVFPVEIKVLKRDDFLAPNLNVEVKIAK